MNTRILALFLTFGLTPAVTAQDAVLITTFTNPTPADYDYFGSAVTAVGSDRVLIGARQDDTGATEAGVAYLFSLIPSDPPTLAIIPSTPGNATLSWAPDMPGFVLQETESLSPINWTNSVTGAANPADIPTMPPGKYFRLIKP